MNKLFKCTLMSIVMLGSAPTFAVPVDLSTWTVDGAGNWMFNSTNAPNDSANQTLNSIPTVLFNGIDSQGMSIAGTIEVQTTADDDFMGFVLGYDANDLFGTNATTDYILVDWKQNTQAGWDAGMSISRVTGGPIAANGTDTSGDAWTHTGNVNFMQRATTLGNTGWADNTEYLFEIIFNPGNIQVSVDGVEQFNINGVFENGSFGFYNFSQQDVRYAGITEDVSIPTDPPTTVPEPGTIGLLGIGLIGLGLARRRRKV
jgi:opacity protein-like surface antigen